MATRAQPGGDAPEEKAVLAAGHVRDRVEGGHRVETGWGQVDRGHVGLDEACITDVLTRQFKLTAGDVHADHALPVSIGI
jgi:hypothetical protein